jgi:replicative superfamily II helicase
MSSTSWHAPVVPYGHETTIDQVKLYSYSTVAVAGVKRNLEGNAVVPSPVHHGQVIPTSFAQTRVLPKQRERPTTRLSASRIVDDHAAAQDLFPAHSHNRATSTPTPTDNPLLSLRHPRYGLPSTLISNFERLGVKSIYPWQSSCLLGKGLLEGSQNLIYTAPTGGGKSLVADILMLRKVLNNPGTKGLLVLPYVALVHEKLRWLRSLVEGVERHNLADDHPPTSHYPNHNRHIQVMGFLGGSRAKVGWADFDIAVCTIEKANALVNSALEDGRVQELGIVVLDELHMLDDEGRGYIMELMATKLLALGQGIQIVGMSATLSNPKVLADWLGAKFYVSKYRPIPIEEHLVYDNAIYDTANAKDFFRTASQLSGRPLSAEATPTQKPAVARRRIERSSHLELENPVINAVVALATETAKQGFGVLVFCSSRPGTERMAAIIADSVLVDGVTEETYDARSDLMASLQLLPNGYESTFNKTIPSGVGFHHAGLTLEEREIIAEAYDRGVLKVMVATCSLAAGINLPARRVIMHGARMGRDLVGPAMLRQMRGRAGRKGKDEVGETYLCCAKSDLEAVAELLEAEMPPVASCLTPEKRGLKRAILEVIATRLANSKETLEEYVRSSLLWQTSDHGLVMGMLVTALLDLLSTELIAQSHGLSYEATTLGSAIVASALTPEDGIFVHAEMQKALASFVMESEMHSLYLFTPIPPPQQSFDIEWPAFLKHLDSLSDADLRAFRMMNVSPTVVTRLVMSGGQLPQKTPEEVTTARVYRRAYTSLQLRDLCNEVPVHEISLRYNVPRGQIQNLAQSCHGFAAGMIKFCERMGSGFSLLGAVLEHMCDRLRAGARADLLDLAKVAFVKSRMARLLWENGFKSVRMLAEARVEDIVPVIMLAQKKKIKAGDQAGEDKVLQKVRSKAEIIVKSAGGVWEAMMLEELDEV